MNFIKDYLLFTSGTEVPQSYRMAACMGALSTLAQRRFWMDMGAFRIYPNMYIVLVGKPADKKSTAMNVARKLMQLNEIPLSPSAVSRERIYQLMDSANTKSPCLSSYEYEGNTVQVSQLALYCNELSTLLSAGGSPEGMIEFLTDIWDKDMHEIETKNKGNNLIIGPYLTMLACMTTEQTQSMMKNAIISGGFSRRCIFVLPDGHAQPVPIPFLTPEQREAEQRLHGYCKSFKNHCGEFTFGEGASDFYVRWYTTNFEKLRNPNSILVGGFLNTLPKFVIQAAMLYELSFDLTKRTLSVDSLKNAIEWLEPVANNLDSMFSGSGANSLASLAPKILELLKTSSDKRMKKKVIQGKLWEDCDVDSLNKVLLHLVQTNQVATSLETVQGTSVAVEWVQLLTT